MNLTIVAGARPNFMKIAPVIHAINEARELGEDIQYRLVHTGQHYDHIMSETFFNELNIPKPDRNLNCTGSTQIEQTASIMTAFEKELTEYPTDLVVVVGDVNSTMACSIVAKKLNTKVAHIEAGIRSWDLSMPEEVNRIVTDSLTDLFFTTSETANKNLRDMGIKEEKIFFVGNAMIDTLFANIDRFDKPDIFDELQLQEKNYLILTMHRPSNVDASEKLKEMLLEIVNNSYNTPIIFPMHPRTFKMFVDLDIEAKNLHVIEPLGYLQFNYLVKNAKAVVTDSGGITEETTILKVPCITLRDNTERPETITIGTNELIGTEPQAIRAALNKLFDGKWKEGGVPELWDGNSAKRIVKHIIEIHQNQNYFI